MISARANALNRFDEFIPTKDLQSAQNILLEIIVVSEYLPWDINIMLRIGRAARTITFASSGEVPAAIRSFVPINEGYAIRDYGGLFNLSG